MHYFGVRYDLRRPHFTTYGVHVELLNKIFRAHDADKLYAKTGGRRIYLRLRAPRTETLNCPADVKNDARWEWALPDEPTTFQTHLRAQAAGTGGRILDGDAVKFIKIGQVGISKLKINTGFDS